MLKSFGVLPSEERAREMLDREYLWCVLNLMLDEEEELERLCPRCRAEAERERCPVCGRETFVSAAGRNLSFDEERYERLKGRSGK